jgi:dGTPase
MYRAPSVMQMRTEVTEVVKRLFSLFLEQPLLLPTAWHAELLTCSDKTDVARMVADYVAGMTDRFALQTHERLIGPVEMPLVH